MNHRDLQRKSSVVYGSEVNRVCAEVHQLEQSQNSFVHLHAGALIIAEENCTTKLAIRIFIASFVDGLLLGVLQCHIRT